MIAFGGVAAAVAAAVLDTVRVTGEFDPIRLTGGDLLRGGFVPHRNPYTALRRARYSESHTKKGPGRIHVSGWPRQPITTSEERPLKYMHSHARRRAMIAAAA